MTRADAAEKETKDALKKLDGKRVTQATTIAACASSLVGARMDWGVATMLPAVAQIVYTAPSLAHGKLTMITFALLCIFSVGIHLSEWGLLVAHMRDSNAFRDVCRSGHSKSGLTVDIDGKKVSIFCDEHGENCQCETQSHGRTDGGAGAAAGTRRAVPSCPTLALTTFDLNGDGALSFDETHKAATRAMPALIDSAPLALRCPVIARDASCFARSGNDHLLDATEYSGWIECVLKRVPDVCVGAMCMARAQHAHDEF